MMKKSSLTPSIQREDICMLLLAIDSYRIAALEDAGTPTPSDNLASETIRAAVRLIYGYHFKNKPPPRFNPARNDKDRWKYIELCRGLRDSDAQNTRHWSDCAVHNAPAMPVGECDCGGHGPVHINSQIHHDNNTDRFESELDPKGNRAWGQRFLMYALMQNTENPPPKDMQIVGKGK